MKTRLTITLPALCCFHLITGDTGFADDQINLPRGARGVLPVDEDGEPLNLDFETGTLEDWTATGGAWEQQPIEGNIDQNREFGAGKRSLHTGEFWLGGYEKLKDPPMGTLTSADFEVTHPFASFLLGGGSHYQTRVELVRVEGDAVFYRTSGVNVEEMRPVVVDLRSMSGERIYIRVVDEHNGGWGHVNFDDFRLHAARPRFQQEVLTPRALTTVTEVYPHSGLPADEAAAVMQVPPGFSVQAVAAEPDVKQPIAMALDDRGRLWIAEAYEYPQRAEAGTGRDRILIFEDTDGDGSLDSRKVFVEGLNLVSGMEVGFGGVYVGAPPYLMFIPDRDGNDVPDGLEQAGGGSEPAEGSADVLQFPEDVPPGATVLLDGWHYEDTHETLNAFIWGPDGWLYGCHGVFTHSRVGKPGTPDDERTPLNAGVWRYHPVQDEFEVFANGTSNPWGVDFNEYGDCFITACVIPHLYHMIPGARYQRQGGAHFNPHTYDDIKTIARHRHFVGNQWNDNDRKASDDLGGGHAHAGAMFYLGGAWPEEYRGQLFMNNIHGARMNVDRVWEVGSGYIGDRADDFLLTGDTWSQMLYMTYGPDGQVWAIDWYDGQQCHRNDVEIHDRSNGRIFRIAYGDTAPVRVDLQILPDVELASLAVDSDNEWYVRHARRILQERAATEDSITVEARDEIQARLFNGGAESAAIEKRLRAMWALHVTNDTWLKDADTTDRLLRDPSPHIRAWTIQLMREDLRRAGISDELLVRLEERASNDDSQRVRLLLASLAGQLPLEDRWGVLEGLIAHAEDENDHNLPLMYWYAMEPLADVDPQRALALAMSAGERIPVLREFMIRRLGSGESDQGLPLLVEGLAGADDDATRLTFLRGIDGALAGQTNPQTPEGWIPAYEEIISNVEDENVRVLSSGIAAQLGTPGAIGILFGEMANSKEPRNQQRAVEFIVRTKDRDALGQLVDLLGAISSEVALRAAIRGFSQFDDPIVPNWILENYSGLSPQGRRDALNTLASRASFGTELLTAVSANRIPRSDLSADLIRQLRNLGDDELNEQIENVWGIVRDSPEEKAALITHYRTLLESTDHSTGDRQLGRAVFARTCQQCHTLFGSGAKIGPDITGSNRADLNYLLSNVIDPSAVMAKEYQPVILATEDGRVVTGIVKEESAVAISVQTANELLTIPRDGIEDLVQSTKSMMPDDLLKALSDHEVRSLVAYVSGAGQTPLLAAEDNVGGFFNLQDLTGWVGDDSLWSVEDGEIVGRSDGLSHNEFLVSELSLTDFRFACQVKLVDNAGNSGIQFRSAPQSGGEVRGYQADIGVGWWGKLYEELGRGLLADNDAEQFIEPGEWNRYEIVAVGSRARTFLNGNLCVDLDDPAGARRGVIAFQLHSGGPTEVRFRGFELELLNPNPLDAPPANTSGSPWVASAGGAATGAITWRRTQLDEKFRGEGVAIADFNNDGLMDVASGSVWFEQPERPTVSGLFHEQRRREQAIQNGQEPDSHDLKNWTMHSILDEPAEFDINGYSQSFMNWPEDLNGDGRLDLIVVDFPGQPTWWFENPGSDGIAAGASWPRHQITPVTNNESPQYVDVNGDGRRELVLGYEEGHIGFASPKTHPGAPWSLTPVSLPGSPGTDRFSHGLGIGDINGDGRDDALVTAGWWEQPEDADQLPWTFHPAPFGAACSQMYVFDFDGDGDADVLSASAHDFGIWWHEQRVEGGGSSVEGQTVEAAWVTHEIDSSYSETHAVYLADINGDGLPDIVTGKRWWSHNGHGPGADGEAVLNWYELGRESGKPVWTKHEIDTDSGVGTQFTVEDVNGDGLLDVVTSNKKGTFLFEQLRE